MQHTLTFFGVSALAMMALLYLRPELAHEASQLLAQPVKPAAAVARAPAVKAPALTALMAAPAPALLAENEPPILALDEKAIKANLKQQEFVTNWLSKRYRVAGDAADMLVSTAYSTAREIKLDPLLILAVMAIESGLNPFAESPVGAQGLMQVMSKIHHEKFQDMGGTQAALNPVANIRVGSLILKEYVKRGGSVEAGLKTYVGAAAFETDQGYGSRVMNEYQKLKLVASGKKVPTFTAPSTPKPVLAEKASQEQIAGL
jgi:soluble lytic murein transglycosylase-like protein